MMRAGRGLGEGHKQAAHSCPFLCPPPVETTGGADKLGARGSAFPEAGPCLAHLEQGEVSGCRATT